EVVGPLPDRHDAQHRARVRAARSATRAGDACAPRAPASRLAVMARGRGPLLFVDQSRGNLSPARTCRGQTMKRFLIAILAIAGAHAWAADPAPPPVPTVSVTASATTSVAND